MSFCVHSMPTFFLGDVGAARSLQNYKDSSLNYEDSSLRLLFCKVLLLEARCFLASGARRTAAPQHLRQRSVGACTVSLHGSAFTFIGGSSQFGAFKAQHRTGSEKPLGSLASDRLSWHGCDLANFSLNISVREQTLPKIWHPIASQYPC